MQEIERKFLVLDDSYKREAFSHSHIRQGYILSAGGRTVRIRLRDHSGYLTIKGPSNAAGLSRYEFEQQIPESDAIYMLDHLCQPGQIDKTRWLVRSGSHVFEVDEFHALNAPLVMAEVELGSEDEPYERPSFIGAEVTGDRRYYNGHLSRRPYSTWQEET